MDTESIKQLVSLLIWGGLFFVMMRFGCGGHLMGGHGHHGEHDGSGDTTGKKIKDPMCGMAVDLQKSTVAATYRGKTYHFCSYTCRDKFERESEKYANAAARGELAKGAHEYG